MGTNFKVKRWVMQELDDVVLITIFLESGKVMKIELEKVKRVKDS